MSIRGVEAMATVALIGLYCHLKFFSHQKVESVPQTPSYYCFLSPFIQKHDSLIQKPVNHLESIYKSWSACSLVK